MTRLFELKDDYVLAMRDMQAAGFDAETIADTLDGMSGDLKDKIRNVVYVVKNLEGDSMVIKEEQDRLAKRQASAKNQIERLKDYLLINMIASGVTIDDPVLPVKLAKCPPSLGEIDVKKVPAEFWTQPETPARQIDRQGLLRAVKVKPIKGVELITDKQRLKIG